MAYRTLDLTLISAMDLKDVNLFSRLQVYSVVSVIGDPRSKHRTPADRSGGRNPIWNHHLRLTVNESAVLRFLLRTERAFGGDRDVGEVHVPLKELLSDSTSVGSTKSASYQVRRPKGKPKGVLNFSYSFSEKVSAAAPPKAVNHPVTAYPAPPPQVGYGYPPPPPAGYPGYPQPAGYGGRRTMLVTIGAGTMTVAVSGSVFFLNLQLRSSSVFFGFL